MRQTQAVLKIADQQRRKEMREQLALQALAFRGDPKELQKILKQPQAID